MNPMISSFMAEYFDVFKNITFDFDAYREKCVQNQIYELILGSSFYNL